MECVSYPDVFRHLLQASAVLVPSTRKSRLLEPTNPSGIVPAHSEPLRFQAMLLLCLKNDGRVRSLDSTQRPFSTTTCSLSLDGLRAPRPLCPASGSPSPSGPSCSHALRLVYQGKWGAELMRAGAG